ncbi:hypothetical protein IEQ34_020638 [Dendrobium chrysotoxum]|uniref:Uncharacterized protein n=1 Tax=Dendrobium chrysotoxum TaxID=161865 RepID=A0AAV7G1E9_DENCH|nr:hypothetical protein IEQ34_020638 [Dendrobium chrysotoxum]
MRQVLQHCQGHYPPSRSSDMVRQKGSHVHCIVNGAKGTPENYDACIAGNDKNSLLSRAKKAICRDERGNPIRRRGRTTCADIQNMSPRTRIHIEVNENNIPCNIPESILLGSYIGVVARDPVLASIAFPDWRNKGMEPFKKKMLAEVEAEYWDSRPIEEFMETVLAGVDKMQWCQLVTQWSKPEDQSIKDRLQLWKINRMHKDGTWSSEDAMQRWTQACNLLVEEGLTPEDGNIEANERVFSIVMGPEHSGRVRTQGFGVTPTRYFPQSTSEAGGGSSSNFAQIASLKEEFSSFRDEMRQFMQQFQMNQPPHGG